MRLTNSDREAFIQAVIDDVPTIDYNELCRTMVKTWAVSRLPDAVKAVYMVHPDYIKTCCYGTPAYLTSVYAVSEHDHYCNISDIDPDFNQQLVELGLKEKAQDQKITELRRQIKGVIYGCTTLKKAKELLPEFEKYLPTDRDVDTDRSMPVVSNLVASLSEAGWPKDQPLAQGK